MHSNPPRILVADGSEVSRIIISRILQTQMSDALITTCATGADALASLAQSHHHLISTSLLLPDMDGLDLSRRIRKSHTHRYTPVIVVSGDADSRLMREGFAAGVTDYFDKSLGYQAFVDFIQSFIRCNPGQVGRILLVEDSATTAYMLQGLMAKHGLEVVHVASAEAALQRLDTAHTGAAAGQERIDIVVTDFYLQGQLTGGDLLYAIRVKLHYSQQEMPVLVITDTHNEVIQAEVFHAGANDFVAKPIVEEILLARIRSLLTIKQQFNALQHQAEEMRRIATTDSLTGVRSKRYLLDHGPELLAEPDNQPVCAILLDIDHFKQINDKLGHITGDRVLSALGEQLNSCIDEPGVVVRFGGEEFAIILPKHNLEQGQSVSEAIRQRIETLRPAGVPLTVSIGVASTRNKQNPDLTRLLQLADEALYNAKAGGRNRVCTNPDQADCT